jgi:predicted DNA binding CopG/RHH family protein
MRTPLRNIRIPDDLWDAAKAKAEARGSALSTVIREFLRRYVARP